MAQQAFHVRSTSFPSRNQSSVPQIDEVLCRISLSRTASSSSSVINSNLSHLRDLYDCVDSLLLLPSMQQSLSQDGEKKHVDNVLDGLLSILDMCSMAKDVLAKTKEHLQQLLSILRRRRGDETELAKEVAEFLATRKISKKATRKCMQDLKRKGTFSSLKKDHESNHLASILSQIQGVTFNVFDSMLCLISGSMGCSNARGWSLVSKLMRSKATEMDSTENEVATVDASLALLANPKCKKETENLQSKLGMLESSIQDLEDELECQFRRLIKIRVSLLNILSY